jgi:hypothetical protein
MAKKKAGRPARKTPRATTRKAKAKKAPGAVEGLLAVAADVIDLREKAAEQDTRIEALQRRLIETLQTLGLVQQALNEMGNQYLKARTRQRDLEAVFHGVIDRIQERILTLEDPTRDYGRGAKPAEALIELAREAQEMGIYEGSGEQGAGQGPGEALRSEPGGGADDTGEEGLSGGGVPPVPDDAQRAAATDAVHSDPKLGSHAAVAGAEPQAPTPSAGASRDVD